MNLKLKLEIVYQHPILTLGQTASYWAVQSTGFQRAMSRT